jgi:tetratricopeptide (TPR) repeat protein
MRALLAALLLAVALAHAAPGSQERITSDFEVATAERSLETAGTSADLITAHLNLGDLRAQRMELERSRGHFSEAEALSQAAAADARRRSDFEVYSMMTAYRGIAFAKLGLAAAAFGAFEESLRYQSDNARVWNYYASAMMVLGRPEKAAAVARNAVLLAEEKSAASQSAADLLDLAIYRYALAGALLEGDPASGEAAELFSSIVDLLGSSRFAALRRQIGRAESFEVFSFVRSDADAWLSLYNRSLLRLGRMRASGGDLAGARQAFLRVLERRSDDPLALAALASLSAGDADRERLFAESFAANPFSPTTILEYERHAREGSPEPSGGAVQRALWLIASDRAGEARSLVASLATRNPENAAISFLEARIALASGDLDAAGAIARRLPVGFRDAIEADRVHAASARSDASSVLSRLTDRSPVPADDELLRAILPLLISLDPEIRERLDRTIFSSIATMDEPSSSSAGVTVFNSGSVGDVRFRFSIPTAFRGEFRGERLRIGYRVTGADRETLLIEPVGIERP